MLEFVIDHVKYIVILLGLLAGFPLVWRRRERLGLHDPSQAALACSLLTALSVGSAMLFAALESAISGGTVSLGAVSTYGVYFICPILLLLLARVLKRDAKSWFDVYALYALPSLFLLRCNCLVSGCCSGRPIADTGLHWPTRQAELVFYAAMLLVLLRREKADAPAGTAFPLLMASYGAFRFIEEWFREAQGAGLIHLAHAWSVAAIVIGLGLYFELGNDRVRGKRTHGERSAFKC